MLPPVFYVQQLEQILLRKLLSPPTPANPARFAFCPRRAALRCRTYVRIQFFVLFSRVEPRPLISRVCVVRPTHLYQYSVFVSHFHFRPRPFGSAFVIFCFLVFPFFLDPYFRRFYDLFLRRKYLESLVRVIRPFGAHRCATKAKKFSGLTFSPAGL